MFEGLLQPTHLVLILAVVLIFFGPGKLPSLGKALGESVRELRRSSVEPLEATAQAGSPAAAAAPLPSTAPTDEMVIQPEQ